MKAGKAVHVFKSVYNEIILSSFKIYLHLTNRKYCVALGVLIHPGIIL